MKPEIESELTTKVEQSITEAETNELTFPEGGLIAWLNVCGSFIVCFCTLGFIQAFGVYQDFYTRHTLSEHSPSQISWIGSIQIYFPFALSSLSGKLFDDGYFRPLLFSASFLLIFSNFMLSITQPHRYYQILLSQGIGQGIAMGLMFLPSISILAHYFSVRRSVVMGIGISGSSIAGVVLPIMLNRFFNGQVGFAWGVRYLGFMGLGLLIIANIIMKPRFSRRRLSSKQQTAQTLKKMITDVPFMMYIFGQALIYWGLYFPLFYLQLFAVLHGIDPTVAFYLLPVLSAASCIGRIIPSFMADHYGVMNLLMPSGFSSGVLIFAMFGAKTAPGIIVFSILYGITSGAYLSLSVSSAANFADNVNEVGIRVGFVMFCLSFPLLTGNPIVGALVRAPLYEWDRPIIFCGVVMLTGSMFVLLSRNQLAKKRGSWRV